MPRARCLLGNSAISPVGAEVPGEAKKCSGCATLPEPKRSCEMLDVEIPKQCCICFGGHGCFWWDLCEGCQKLKDGDWGIDDVE